MTVPAGWYDDGAGRQRWWDGAVWTEHTVTTETSSVANTPQEHGQHATEEPTVAASADPIFEPPYAWQSSNPSPGASAEVPQYGRASMPATSAGVVASPDATAGFGSYGPVPPKANTKVSVLGIIGLGMAALGVVLSCIPPISMAGGVLLGIGFVLSLISLFLRGAKWPGAVGIAVAVLGGVVAIAMMLLTLGASGLSSIVPTSTSTPQATQSTEPDDTAEGSPGSAGTETVTVNELEVGHCIPLIEWEEEVYELPIVPCDAPHTDEVYFIFDVPEGEFPGDDELQTIAAEKCDVAFEEFVGIPYADSELDNYWFVPTESSWKRMNDRAVQCIVISYDEITGTLEGADR
ncbi:DUF2510 domain-containing protein [uncultured Microbacterium sp.]|uniref:DUF2510 domain-containing protein n=1 Tax=uncultured Microbacterium sp. TaxID=191216 RepID=UPI0025FEEAC2|nr:DUF2510 domain-containing protein [uncultured Microbacterium sp.]